MMNEVKCLLLLAKVYKSHKKEDVVETLNQVIGPSSLSVAPDVGPWVCPAHSLYVSAPQ